MEFDVEEFADDDMFDQGRYDKKSVTDEDELFDGMFNEKKIDDRMSKMRMKEGEQAGDDDIFD